MVRDGDYLRHGPNQPCRAYAHVNNRVPAPPPAVATPADQPADQTASPSPSPGDSSKPAEGETMTETTPAATPTGEVVNFETAMAELDKLEQAQREHLDQAKAALTEIQQAKERISDTQATYRPAAEAAGQIHEHLVALGIDAETAAATGTITDAMPPNRVDEMFNHLEAMEADAQQQVENAETALAATAAARTSLIEKYGDASTTVQEHLGGDSRFLSGSGAVQA